MLARETTVPAESRTFQRLRLLNAAMVRAELLEDQVAA